ncbi:MAG: YggS family pyridoxal phosphate-dependent enzyme [Clostridiales bacterium]|nr:YggS family pyridoxal phosphate-dependent enzyme [Clostridiales bacterium]
MDYIQNINKIKENVRRICLEYARDEKGITIVAAVKTQTSQTVKDLAGALADVGENRVQEFIEHYDAALPFRWHFIGRLQTNKVKYLIGKNVLIHSLDREDLANEINRLSVKNGIITECLAEVNMAKEETKGGVFPEDLPGFLKAAEKYKGIKVSGLMSVLPAISGGKTEEYYAALQKLFEEAKSRSYEKNIDIKYLSAGMSNDYNIAIKYGANIIRPGTVIFGERKYV